MRSILDRQFILAVPFIFPVPFLFTQRKGLFPTSLSTVLHCWNFIWRVILLGLIILLKNKELMREIGITGLLEVTVTVCYLMVVDSSRELSGF